MSATADACIEIFRSTLDRVDRLHDPAERDRIYSALVADLRSRRPVAVSCLSDWSPTEEPPTSPPGGEAA